jgi:SAM-dependent methyltransferase
MVVISECPACGHNAFSEYLLCKDHSMSGETFTLLRCTTCNLLATSPRPEENNLPAYYQSEEYISHSGKTSGFIGWAYPRIRAFALRQKSKLIHSYHPHGTLLDMGCGTGEFLMHMQRQGWSVSGIEPSLMARAKAENGLRQTVAASLDDLTQNDFTVITLWHVLEHLPNPVATLEALATKLQKNGTLLVAVPNPYSLDAHYYKDFWAGYDVPRHLWHFSTDSIKKLAGRAGLMLIDQKPMYFDSYYVSMLAERYKNGTGFASALKGAFTGLRSNLSARSTGNYSSLIYIFKTS